MDYKYSDMGSTYHSKDFMEISSSSRFPLRVSESLDGSCFSFNSSDESFNSSSGYNSRKLLEKKNCELSSEDGSSSGSNSLSESDTNGRRRREVKSIIKFLKIWKYFSKKTELKSEQQNKNQSIYRRPAQYTLVRGMSGLSFRVIKASTSTCNCCQWCTLIPN